MQIVTTASGQQAATWRRPDIQGLRAIAVLLVVTYHAGLPIPGGFTGVDVFFVISGFVITQLILRRHASGGFRLTDFYARRMKRLLPALGLLIFVVLIAAIFLQSPFGAQGTTAATALGASFFVANFVIFANSGGYFDPPAEVNPLLHTWSLSVEEQFYFVFPVLLALIWWVAARRKISGTTTALILLTVLTLASFALGLAMSFDAWTFLGIADASAWAFYSSATRAWEFGIGALVALAFARWTIRITAPIRSGLALTGITLILGGALIISSSTPFPGLAALLPVLGTAMVITGGTQQSAPRQSLETQTRVTKILGLPGLVWIGDLSYSWYLWHWPVIVFTRLLWPANEVLLLAAGALSLIPAWLAYRFVENPIRTNPNIAGKRLGALIVLTITIPAAAALGVRWGADRWWGSTDIEQMANQIVPLPVSFTNGCDDGIPLGQQGDLMCTWDGAGEPIYLVGDSLAGQLAEAVIGSGSILNRPVTIATLGSCPFVVQQPDADPIASPECLAFTDASIRWLVQQSPATIVLGMSANYVGPDTRTPLQVALTYTVELLQRSGHRVVLTQATPQYFGWGPWDCSLIDTLISTQGCGTSEARTIMDDSQVLALDFFAQVGVQTQSHLFDFRDELCPNGICATNIGDRWIYRDAFHITVDQSRALTLPLAGVIAR